MGCKWKKSQVYVKDLRSVMIHNGKRLRYPKNYNKIVESCDIIVGTGPDGNVQLKLLYGKPDKKGLRHCQTLVQIIEDKCHSKAYYSMHMLSENLDPTVRLASSCYEPFGFSSVDIKTYIPVIDIKKTDDPNNPYQLATTLYLAKKGCTINEDTAEVDPNNRKDKGLNGKLLYNSSYEKIDSFVFYIIRDELDKVEIDKSIISLPIATFSSVLKFCRKLVTFLPMKLGECFLKKKNPVAKFFGFLLFAPFVPVKFIVDLSAVLAKLPILLFTANEKKYADKYYTLWKHEFIDCFHELASDCSLITNGESLKSNIEEYPEYTLIGTWEELNVRRKNALESLKCEPEEV